LQKVAFGRVRAGLLPVWACGEWEVVHVGDGLDRVMESVVALPAVAEEIP
jgi:hypothetical protein